MTARATSKAALLAIAAKLPAKRMAAYRLVRGFPGKTAVELEKLTGDLHLHKRLSELEALGLVIAEKVDRKTGMVWREADPTVDMFAVKKKPSRAQLRKALAAAAACVGLFKIGSAPTQAEVDDTLSQIKAVL